MSAGERERSAIGVLVVDDHPIVRQGLVSVLSRAGGIAVVAEAGTAKEALDLFRRCAPTVVVLDLMLPDMDGPRLIRALREIDPGARVVVLSSFGSEADIRRSVEAGALGYLLKDTEDEELILAVRRAAQGLPAFSPVTTAPLLHAVREQHLTAKELEVLQLLVDGLEDPEMARRLEVSVNTVKTHLSNASRKLGVHDRGQLVVMALRRGLVRLPSAS